MTTAQRLGSTHQVRPGHHAQGQGTERRPRPPADADLDHVSQVPRRHGSQARGGGQAGGKKFQPVIEPPYRWRDWAAKADGITGDDLLTFINNEETMLPDGNKGAGLFAYLRMLQFRTATTAGM